jgi:hypothetical protein
MTKLDRTHKAGILLGVFLLVTLLLKWRLFHSVLPYEYTATAYIGSAIATIFILGSLFGAIGLIFKKSWGCIASYLAAIGATSIGISVIPWITKLLPVGYARTYAVFGLNIIFIIMAWISEV